ncbi:MAG: oxidoreductase [Acidimicrobiales bacterium]
MREVPGGIISPRLVHDLRAGQRLEVRGPVGRFAWTGDDGLPVLLVGAGSGLVPLMAMVRYAVAADREVPMCLVCSAVTFEHALYREELARLSVQHHWLRVVQCVTRDAGDPRADYHRRIDRELLAEVLDGQIPPQAYLCGPPAMVGDAARSLADLGVDPSRIRSEKYD